VTQLFKFFDTERDLALGETKFSHSKKTRKFDFSGWYRSKSYIFRVLKNYTEVTELITLSIPVFCCSGHSIDHTAHGKENS
jgi:hypothetical protein